MRLRAHFFPVLLCLVSNELLAGTTTNWYFHDDGSEKTGSACKTLQCTIERSGNRITLSILSLWQPGASVEIHGEATAVGVKIIPSPKGSSVEEISFAFEDSFGNAGTGRFSILGSTATLQLTVTKPNSESVIGNRGSRQYDGNKFVLKKIDS